jgi:hypothetical protein
LRLRARLRAAGQELIRSEQGIALPVAMLITVIALGMAAVPIVASVNSQSGDSRNQSGNEARAAAEAGAELALLRQSEILPPATSPCIVEVASKLVTNNEVKVEGTGEWCGKVSGTVGNASFTYQVRPCYPESKCGISPKVCATPASETLIQVVSTGFATVAGRQLTKRVRTNACSNVETSTKTEQVPDGKPVITYEETPPPNVFAKGQVIGVDWLSMHDNFQVKNGGAGTNGAVTMVGSANVCGTVNYGTTKTANNGSENAPAGCPTGRTFVQGTAEYPPVALPSNIATVNSNSRLASGDVTSESNRSNISWNASNRSLSTNYGTLTLGGSSPYFLCQLTLGGGSTLEMVAGAKIRVFFDAPQNCPGLNGSAQLQIANGTKVSADSANGPGFYFVGSTTAGASRIELAGGGTGAQIVIYAPYSAITYDNGSSFRGAIIGRTMDVGGGAINESGAFTPPPLTDFLAPTKKETTTEGTTTKTTTTSTSLTFTRRSFVECAAASTVPGAGC